MDKIEDAIADFKEGKFVIVVDDEDRENEGDLIIAAEKITPEKVNFMLKHARGVLCAPVTVSRCKELDLPHQVSDNTSVLGTPFTVTIDKLEGCTTGVSASDRAAASRERWLTLDQRVSESESCTPLRAAFELPLPWFWRSRRCVLAFRSQNRSLL